MPIPKTEDLCANCNRPWGHHFMMDCYGNTTTPTMFNTFVDKKNVEDAVDHMNYVKWSHQEIYIAMLKWIDQHREELML